MIARALTLRLGAALVGAARQVHGLPVLLCLESAVIVCFVTLILRPEVLFAAVFLSTGAVEGAMGLRCLIGLVRSSGRDLVHTALAG